MATSLYCKCLQLKSNDIPSFTQKIKDVLYGKLKNDFLCVFLTAWLRRDNQWCYPHHHNCPPSLKSRVLKCYRKWGLEREHPVSKLLFCLINVIMMAPHLLSWGWESECRSTNRNNDTGDDFPVQTLLEEATQMQGVFTLSVLTDLK